MHDAQASYDFIPDGVEGVVTVCQSDGAAGSDQVLAAVHDTLRDKDIPRILVKASGSSGFFSVDTQLTIARPGMATVLYRNVTPDMVSDLLSGHLVAGKPNITQTLCQTTGAGEPAKGIPSIDEVEFFTSQQRAISHRCGAIDPLDMDDVLRTGGYQTMEAALALSPEEARRTLENTALHGHGGRGQPVTAQWIDAAERPGETCLVCNALEVEEGSVKDRHILEGDPHALIEGMVIAAHAVGAHMGYVVINPTYTLARHRLETAIAQARRQRRLGRGIRGRSLDFDIIVRPGPTGYVMGEETALVSFLEGEAGPRVTPPHVTESGVNGQPTIVSNVETFVRLTTISFDPEVEDPPPTRLFTLEGTVNTGVVEVEVGTTIRNLICGIGGTPEAEIKAVCIGGRLGGILSPDLLDTPLTTQSYRWLGIWPGTGLVSVLDPSTSILAWLQDHLHFAARESRGCCTPCREGLAQADRIASRLGDGQGQASDLSLLDQLTQYVKSSSMCSYGYAVPSGVSTAIRYFGKEIREQIASRR